MKFVKMLPSIGTWILQALLALMFVAVGTGKFGDPSWPRKFSEWGYPDGFYMVVGVVEALGGVLLLVPKLTKYAAVTLMVVMIGATATLLRAHQPPVAPLADLALLGLVAWLRWK